MIVVTSIGYMNNNICKHAFILKLKKTIYWDTHTHTHRRTHTHTHKHTHIHTHTHAQRCPAKQNANQPRYLLTS